MTYSFFLPSSWKEQVLFTPCADWMAAACGGQAAPLPSEEGACRAPGALAASLPAGAHMLIFFASLPALTAETVARLTPTPSSPGGCLRAEGRLLAAGVRADDLAAAEDGEALLSSLPEITPAASEEALVWSPEALPALSACLRDRVAARHIAAGALIPFPEAVYIAPAVRIAAGAAILPGSILRGETTVAAGAVIGPNSLLENAVIGEGVTVNSAQVLSSTVAAGATVGPFAYIRPGCIVGEGARVGDFVELKNAHLGKGTKVSHLTYLGDARVGAGVNFGCGTVAVNYDGAKKHITTVEDGAFIGCNTNLIAPVTVGKGAYVAAGSTITDDVPEDALGIARARQTNKEGWAARLRQARGK